MDRNLYYQDNRTAPRRVALRKESVDRNINCNSNFTQKKQSLSARRAWIEMSFYAQYRHLSKSLSARRAWIEMTKQLNRTSPLTVALRKESVDRNNNTTYKKKNQLGVALRKESVDRNFNAMQIVIIVVGRSPQGERG